MGTIYRSGRTDVSADAAWNFLERYARAEVHVFSRCTAERLEGEYRVVNTIDDEEFWERNVTVDPDRRRAVYTVTNFPGAEHHQAEMRVVEEGGAATLSWTTDVLPNEVAAAMEPVYDVLFAELLAAVNGG
jgi:hypothetical protein